MFDLSNLYYTNQDNLTSSNSRCGTHDGAIQSLSLKSQHKIAYLFTEKG